MTTEPKFKYSYEECLACKYSSDTTQSHKMFTTICFRFRNPIHISTEQLISHPCSKFKPKVPTMTTTTEKRDWRAELKEIGQSTGKKYKTAANTAVVIHGDMRYQFKDEPRPLLSIYFGTFCSYSPEGECHIKTERIYDGDIVGIWEEPVVRKTVKVKRVKLFYTSKYLKGIHETAWYLTIEEAVKQSLTVDKESVIIIKEEWQEFDEPVE